MHKQINKIKLRKELLRINKRLKVLNKLERLLRKQ